METRIDIQTKNISTSMGKMNEQKNSAVSPTGGSVNEVKKITNELR